MDTGEQDKHWLVRRDTIKQLWAGFGVILLLLVLSDWLLHPHPYFGIDGTFGFYAWFGLSTCAAMVVFAKVLGFMLKRKDAYYDA